MIKNTQISVVQESKKKKAISLTTYRALFIAKLLSLKAMNYDEIASALTKDKFLATSCHKDTILNSINSLRTAGFDISKPKPSNDYKFQLISHPLKFKLTQEQAEMLHLIRNSLYYQNNYELIFNVNDIYNKIKQIKQ